MKHSFWITGLLWLLFSAPTQASVTKAHWGSSADGSSVDIYTIQNRDLSVRITNFGARIVSIETPDRTGARSDVVLGYDNFSQYQADKSYFGAVVGRYGNRIAGGTFAIDGETSHIPLNNGPNALHGGPEGFHRKVWTGRALADGVEMALISPDGEMGFPGTMAARVRYTLQGHTLRLDYSAMTTKPTIVNLTNHTYFNLAGNGRGTILDEILTINADLYTLVDASLIPTGELASVQDTPFDFRKPVAIGARIDAPNQQLKFAGGYDHNFVLNARADSGLHFAAHVYDPSSGRTLTVRTTEPGMQFYSGNFLAGKFTGKSGVAYPKHAAFVLETQHFPDSPNHANFPSTLLKPGRTLHSTTLFTFGVRH